MPHPLRGSTWKQGKRRNQKTRHLTQRNRMAMSGSITVQFGAETLTYTFGPDSIGSSAAEHRPFLYSNGVLFLEDLAHSALAPTGITTTASG